ncbi:LysR substrate-binding domain-containing protein [Stenotrophomonas sp. YAU14A_MKIMI4_1]|uniref:LysR substrate-binding domain-containing protein n=1 Tax=Stenotrophomonas sp. YAU14A_MKIMI4_1 TaxID=2072408 RepID=UPI000D53F794|nr:LysR substrate-binding domain-containing protein [Stenotrophomonas sp. YAU14A_MKIMI4_1]AWH30689.1 LysR family transcriptional regulator [Stenotrophomonas sp. YAU14A_MKIMI4_1]
MIDIRPLRYFLAVAETLHFGRAAERLHVTQPPLSRQIAALERSLGVALFERDSRHVRLTPAGQRFREDARAVLASLQQACHTARQIDAGEQGELQVGFMMHAAHSSVPPLARRFMAACPQVQLRLREALPFPLLDGVLSGELDAGIGFAPAAMRGLQMQPLLQEPLCVVVPQDHRLARRRQVAVAALADEGLITAPAEVVPTLREAIDACFRAVGLEPRIRLEVQLQQSIVSLVAEGLGIALVPASLRRLGVPGVAFVGLKDAPQVQQVLFWRDGNRNPALARLLACITAT